MFVSVYICNFLFVCVCVCMYSCIYINVCVCVCVCVCVFMCVHTYTHIHCDIGGRSRGQRPASDHISLYVRRRIHVYETHIRVPHNVMGGFSGCL